MAENFATVGSWKQGCGSGSGGSS